MNVILRASSPGDYKRQLGIEAIALDALLTMLKQRMGARL